MKQKIQLQIPKPCHENWNDMTAMQQGRFCMSCQKQVIDFSVMTDKEILNYISTAGTNTCGRIANDQMNRDLIAPPEPRKIWWSHWMSAAASLVLLASKSNAQVKFSKDTIVATPPLTNGQKDVVVVGKILAEGSEYYKKNFTVTGIVKDENNNPVPRATVMIKDTRTGAIADETGTFTIRINDEKNVVLRISSVGYEPQDIKVDNHNAQLLVNLKVELRMFSTGLMGDVVIVAKRKKNIFNYFKKDTVKTEIPKTKEALTIYPNPVVKGTDIKMNIDNLRPGDYKLAVYDVTGNAIAAKELKITGSNVKETLRCDERFTGGLYVISITGSGKTISSKCMVQ